LQYKRPKRPISGVLLLDKPAGYSSNQALQRAKHMYMAAKAGHTGNLDPFATGLLPLCFGEATKFSQTLLDADKVYRAVLKLGIMTTTGDTEGEVTSQMPVELTYEQVERAVLSFTGPITQVPPMYSALKYQGRPLYEYARNGVEIERKARDVNIHEIRLVSFSGDEAEIYVSCSKGTYIRVLAEDIGKQLGCGAHLIVLQRLNTGGFRLADAYTLAQLEVMDASTRDALLLPVDALLQGLPMVELDADAANYFRQGQAIWKSGIQQSGLIRVYAPQNVFLGLAENVGDGRIAPRRVLATEF
jgi:tRNA pseudouridine55 synthase